MWTPISEAADQQGDNIRICSSPINYLDGSAFIKIDPSHSQKIGDKIFRNKGKVKQEFEDRTVIYSGDGWSLAVWLKAISKDDKDVKIDAKHPNVKSGKPKETELSGFDVVSGVNQYRAIVPCENTVDTFKIKFTLTPTGLTMVESDGRVLCQHNGETVLTIANPVLLGDDMQDLAAIADTPLVSSTFTDNGNGTYEYTKTPGPGFATKTLPESYWIDINIEATSLSGSVEQRLTNANWSYRRSQTIGQSVTATGKSYSGTYYAASWYQMWRGHSHFTLPALDPGTFIVSASLHVYADSSNGTPDPTFVIQKSTASLPLGTEDFASYVGGIGGATVCSGAGVSVPSAGWYEFVLTDLDYVTAAMGGTLKLGIIERAHDYLNVDPVQTWNLGYWRYYGGTNNQYVELTIGTATQAVSQWLGFTAFGTFDNWL